MTGAGTGKLLGFRHQVRRPGRQRATHKLLRFAVATLAGLLAVLGAPTAAFAGDGPWESHVSSPCSYAVSGKTGGGYGFANIQYDAYRATTRRYVIEYARGWADGFQQCATGTAVSPYTIQVEFEFVFDGNAISCGVGIDISGGFSYTCSNSGNSVVLKSRTTCANFSSSCRMDQGYMEVLVPPGSSFYNYVNARVNVTVLSSGGTRLDWSSHYV